jgi:hypothetical protein
MGYINAWLALRTKDRLKKVRGVARGYHSSPSYDVTWALTQQLHDALASIED